MTPAALPASAEAAVGTLKQLGLTGGETLLVLGAAGSVGMTATQQAVTRGATVIGAAGGLATTTWSAPSAPSRPLRTRFGRSVREIVPSVDAVRGAVGKGGLPDAIDLARGAKRAVTLSHEPAADPGLAFSVPSKSPDPPVRVPAARQPDINNEPKTKGFPDASWCQIVQDRTD